MQECPFKEIMVGDVEKIKAFLTDQLPKHKTNACSDPVWYAVEVLRRNCSNDTGVCKLICAETGLCAANEMMHFGCEILYVFLDLNIRKK